MPVDSVATEQTGLARKPRRRSAVAGRVAETARSDRRVARRPGVTSSALPNPGRNAILRSRTTLDSNLRPLTKLQVRIDAPKQDA